MKPVPLSLSVHVEHWPIAGSFTISRGAKSEAVVVIAELSDGAHHGRGECVPYARYGESVEGVITALQAMSGAVTIALIPKCFPASVRTAGLSVAYATGVAVFGGSAQFVFTWLIANTGDPLSPAWWVIASNLVTIYAVLKLRPFREMTGEA